MRSLSASGRAITALLVLLLVTVAACGPAPEGNQGGDTGNQATGTQPASTGAQAPGCGNQEGPIKIGAIFDVTGGASSLGEPERNTAQLLEEQINAEGGIDGRDVDITVYDSQSDETQAVTAAQRAINQDNVVAIVGGTTTGATMAMVDTVQSSRVPLISVAAGVPIIEPVKEWVFKTPQTDTLAIRRLFPYFEANNIKRIGFLASNNAYGDSGRAELLDLAREGGYEVVADERYGLQDTDMTAQLTRIKNADPDAVINWSIPPTASTVTRNFEQLGFDVPLIQSHGVANQAYLEQSGDAAEGVVLPIGRLPLVEQLPDDHPQKEVLQEFTEQYQEEFGSPPNTFAGHAWDGFQMLFQAIDEVGTDCGEIRSYLENDIKNFVGTGGIFNMSPTDHMGLGVDAFELVEVRDGDWQILEQYPVEEGQ